jgi:PTH2 family peptidyl-tRNA hydrolase
MKMKQAIVIRTDLDMGKGKLCAQSSHASLAAFLEAGPAKQAKWLKEGAKKVVLKVKGEHELVSIYNAAFKAKLPCALIVDRGLTQIPYATKTAAGIGPDADLKIDKITGKLKLL